MSEGRELTVGKDVISDIRVSERTSAVSFEKIGDMMDFSKLMAVSDKAVPGYLRNNVGACLAITVQANEWGMSPFSVARMSYAVGDTVGYMAQLLHAVVERRAPLKNRLRFTFLGEGVERQVVVTGHFRGEVDPVEYVSPKIRDIKVKNSPLWVSDPDQQLCYYGSRAWARRYCPDVLLGVYSADELEGIGADRAKDITPDPSTEPLHHRLSAKAVAGAGFDPKGVATVIDEAAGRAPPPEPVKETASPVRSMEEAQAASDQLPGPPGDVGTGAADLSPGSTPGDAPASQQVTAATESTHSDSVAQAEPDASAGVAFKPVAPPVDGPDYVRYVGEKLKGPMMDVEGFVREWWKSTFERGLRNTLPNYDKNHTTEAMALVTEHIKGLKAEA